jgi:hypothetical protein
MCLGWGCGSVVECLPSMYEALYLITTSKKKKKKPPRNTLNCKSTVLLLSQTGYHNNAPSEPVTPKSFMPTLRANITTKTLEPHRCTGPFALRNL